jgi:hypothetical protein
MNNLKFLTNLSGVFTKDVRVNKNQIIQTDETNILFVKSNATGEVFNSEFVIRDLPVFAKLAGEATEMKEEKTKIVLKKTDTTIEYMKADSDIVPKPEKIPELDYSDSIKVLLTDEVKAKIIEGISTGFASSVILSGDKSNISIAIGGKEGNNKYSAILGATDKEFSTEVSGEYLKKVLECTSGESSMHLKSSYPVKVEIKTEDYNMEIFIAPKTGE